MIALKCINIIEYNIKMTNKHEQSHEHGHEHGYEHEHGHEHSHGHNSDSFLAYYDANSTYKNDNGYRTGKLYKDGKLIRDFDAERASREHKIKSLEHNKYFNAYSDEDQEKFVTNPYMFFILERFTNQLLSQKNSANVSSNTNTKPDQKPNNKPDNKPDNKPKPAPVHISDEEDNFAGLFD